MEALSTFETSVSFYQTTRRTVLQYSLHSRRNENLNSYGIQFVSSFALYKNKTIHIVQILKVIATNKICFNHFRAINEIYRFQAKPSFFASFYVQH
jgi:hypothetical protein